MEQIINRRQDEISENDPNEEESKSNLMMQVDESVSPIQNISSGRVIDHSSHPTTSSGDGTIVNYPQSAEEINEARFQRFFRGMLSYSTSCDDFITTTSPNASQKTHSNAGLQSIDSYSQSPSSSHQVFHDHHSDHDSLPNIEHSSDGALPYNINYDWMSSILINIMDISLDRNGRGVYLERFSTSPSKDDINSLLWEVFSLSPENVSDDFTIISYTFECINRIRKQLVAQHACNIQRIEFLQKIEDQLLTWLTLTFQVPHMFPIIVASMEKSSLIQAREFCDLLCQRKIPEGILHTIVDKMVKDNGYEALERFFSLVFLEVTSKVRSSHISSSQYSLPYEALSDLVKNKLLAELLVTLPNWLPKDKSQRDLELRTYLGPFLRLDMIFDTDSQEDTDSKHNDEGCRKRHNMVVKCQQIISDVIYTLLKNPSCRDYMLDWLTEALSRSRNRGLQEEGYSASESFMITISSCLLLRCVPLLNVTNGQYLRIDPEYLLKSNRLKSVIAPDTTLFSATLEERRGWMETRKMALAKNDDIVVAMEEETEEIPYITECFYLTLAALDVGMSPIYLKHSKIVQAYNQIDIAFMNSRPPTSLEARYAELHRVNNDLTLRLTDSRILLTTFYFLELVCVWLVKLARSGVDVDSPTSFSLRQDNSPTFARDSPLPTTVSMTFRVLPEFILDCVADFFLWASEHWTDFRRQYFNNIIASITTFISSPYYVRPYLRGKLVEVMAAMIPKRFGPKLEINPFEFPYVSVHLGPALSRLYVDMERLGTSSSFYDKFNTRYYISTVLGSLWKGSGRTHLVQAWLSDVDGFMAFGNMLINDSLYLLDESITILSKISSFDNNYSADCYRSTEEAEEFSRLMRKAKVYLTLAKETVRVLYFLSRDFPHPFMREELMDRLATMLNSFVSQLCGSHGSMLGVETSESEYKFDPKWLLKKVCNIIVYFYVDTPAFAKNLARDKRSYSYEVYAKARSVLDKWKLLSKKDLIGFDSLINEAEYHVKVDKSMEDLLGDIPDEFLDAILSTLMKDPVRLPSSSVVLDRSTIERHLLSDSSDPFNRQPLTVEQLIPLPELRKKIEDFVAQKLCSKL